MLAQVSRQFGGRPMADGVEIRAADLFLPGEALLSARGEAQIAALARRFANAPAVEIRSHGADARHERFDEWDLAAARLGAVARALQARGLVRDRLLIRGLDQADGQAGQGQWIRVAPGSKAAG